MKTTPEEAYRIVKEKILPVFARRMRLLMNDALKEGKDFNEVVNKMELFSKNVDVWVDHWIERGMVKEEFRCKRCQKHFCDDGNVGIAERIGWIVEDLKKGTNSNENN